MTPFRRAVALRITAAAQAKARRMPGFSRRENTFIPRRRALTIPAFFSNARWREGLQDFRPDPGLLVIRAPHYMRMNA